jgi:hypothetical protein
MLIPYFIFPIGYEPIDPLDSSNEEETSNQTQDPNIEDTDTETTNQDSDIQKEDTSETDDIQIDDAEINDTDINDTDINDTDINDTDINDTDINDNIESNTKSIDGLEQETSNSMERSSETTKTETSNQKSSPENLNSGDDFENFPAIDFDFLEESTDYSRFKAVYSVGFDYIVQPMLHLSRDRWTNRDFSTDLYSGVALQLESGFRLWDGVEDENVSWTQFRKNATPSASLTFAYRTQQITSMSSGTTFIDSTFGLGFHSLDDSHGLEDYLVGRDGGLFFVGTRRNMENNKTQWNSSLQLQKEIGRHLVQIQFLGTIFYKNENYPLGCAFSIGTGWRL